MAASGPAGHGDSEQCTDQCCPRNKKDETSPAQDKMSCCPEPGISAKPTRLDTPLNWISVLASDLVVIPDAQLAVARSHEPGSLEDLRTTYLRLHVLRI